MTDCLFCKIINHELPSFTIYENDAVSVFMDIRPTTPGHLLVVPKEHSADMLSASAHALDGMLAAVKTVVPAQMRAVKADGWNLEVNSGASAGQVIDHTHWHIIPRHADDGLRHWPPLGLSEAEIKKIAEDIRSSL